MTTVDILFRYSTPPTEAATQALAQVRDVYGIRRTQINAAAYTLLVEYDASRLSAATVANIVRSTGLQVAEELPLIPPQPVAEATEPATPKA